MGIIKKLVKKLPRGVPITIFYDKDDKKWNGKQWNINIGGVHVGNHKSLKLALEEGLKNYGYAGKEIKKEGKKALAKENKDAHHNEFVKAVAEGRGQADGH